MSKHIKLVNTEKSIGTLVALLGVEDYKISAAFREHKNGYEISIEISEVHYENVASGIHHRHRVADPLAHRAKNNLIIITEITTEFILGTGEQKFGVWINHLAQPVNTERIRNILSQQHSCIPSNEGNLLYKAHPDQQCEMDLFDQFNIMGISYLELLILKMLGGAVNIHKAGARVKTELKFNTGC